MSAEHSTDTLQCPLLGGKADMRPVYLTHRIQLFHFSGPRPANDQLAAIDPRRTALAVVVLTRENTHIAAAL
jgi:hypothetical protein